jgi:hypothetical protein
MLDSKDIFKKIIWSIVIIFTFRFVDHYNWYFVGPVVKYFDLNVWLFYPPAFLRLMAFLLLGYAAIPALFLAQLWSVDFGLNQSEIIIVSAFLAVGGPLAVDMASKATSLKSSLSNLTPSRLLVLSLACAVGNAIFMRIGLSIVDFEKSKTPDYLSIVIGDTAGTWVMMYIIKIGLTVWGRSLRRH